MHICMDSTTKRKRVNALYVTSRIMVARSFTRMKPFWMSHLGKFCKY